MPNLREFSDLSINFENVELLNTKESKLQDIKIYRHPSLGKILVINGEVQHVQVWAPLYHELLVHLPTAFIPELKKVLILGGGSLFAAAEVLKYTTVKKVVLIDHDKTVIDLMKNNYSHARNVLKDKRIEIIVNDAFIEVNSHYSEGYDLVINDSVDLIKQGHNMSLNLLKNLSKNLNINGICSDVVYRHIFEKKTTLKTIKYLRKSFYNAFSLITIPEYPGIFHVLCLWSNSNTHIMNNTVLNKIQLKWVRNKIVPCQFYNPKFLKFYTYFPNYLKNVLVKI